MHSPSIPAVLIEDEKLSLGTLQNLLHDYIPAVQVIGTAGSVQEGVALLQQTDPKLVFLDIAMPDGDAFDLLGYFPNPSFQVIFTTAYEEYAIRAFDFAACSYLLKPISSEDLQKAVARYRLHQEHTRQTLRLQIARESMRQQYHRIVLPSQQGLDFIDIDDILYCQAEQSYTHFFLANNRRVMVSNSLGHYEKLLSHALFYRIHHRYLVNLRHIKQYIKGSGGYVLLHTGQHLDVSVRRKDGFLAAIRRAM